MTVTTIHPEFFLIPHSKGIQLCAPEKTSCASGVRVQDILQIPMNVYFQQEGELMLECNEQVFLTHCFNSLGFYSHRDLQGVHAHKFAKPEYIQKIKKNDQQTLKNGRLTIFEEEILRLDDLSASVLTFKFPCFLDYKKPPIVFGISLLLDKTLSPTAATLSTGLPILLASGLISSTASPSSHNWLPGQEIEGVYLTAKQVQCLELALRGMTAKKIGAALGISFRTVERHFENLKHRLNVQSKSELLEKVISHRQNCS